ncbi:tellurium resistance protein TerC, partial [Lactobacillus paragasseri]
NSISGWTTLILIIFVVLFAADIVTNDRKYYSVLKDIPLSKNTILWIKTGVVEIGVLFNYLLAFIVVTLCTAPRYGF